MLSLCGEAPIHALAINAMKTNDPEVVAELQALYRQYEAALVGNDVEALTQMFWASPQAMRFGVTENLYGIDEIAAFRKGRSAVNLARTVLRTDIVTFGSDYGSVTIEFERKIDGGTISGRQSQAWVRFSRAGGLLRHTYLCFPDFEGRRWAIDRRLFCPKVAAILSVAESCRRLKLSVRDYLAAVLPRLADLPIQRLADLTPAMWLARHSWIQATGAA
jgi:hypothetical protein